MTPNAPIPDQVLVEIGSALAETLQACRKHDFNALKYISNHTIHTASIYQDQDSLSFAVIIYALFKISQRVKQKKRFGKNITPVIARIKQAVEEKDSVGYRKRMKTLFDTIAKLDERFKQYIDEVIQYAQAKKGAKLYEHGVSVARAAEMIGITHWELMSHVGKTKIPEQERGSESILQRLRFARKLFVR